MQVWLYKLLTHLLKRRVAPQKKGVMGGWMEGWME